MPKSKSRKKKTAKRVLALPDLEQTKTAVLNSLTSASGQRTYDHAIRAFVAWYFRSPASDTIAGVQALALRVIAERLENREAPAELLDVTFQAA